MNTPILNVRGIGPATAELLAENGITSAQQLADLKVGTLAAVKGFSETRARQVIADAKALFAVSTKGEAQDVPAKAKDTVEKKKKKDKKTDKKAAAKTAEKKDKKKKEKKKGKKGKKKK